jgi:hypothetical protein
MTTSTFHKQWMAMSPEERRGWTALAAARRWRKIDEDRDAEKAAANPEDHDEIDRKYNRILRWFHHPGMGFRPREMPEGAEKYT